MQVDQVLIMRKAQFPADMMDFLIGDLKYTRCHRFDAKRRDLLPAKPARGFDTHSGSVVPVVCPKCASIVIRVQQDGIALLDFKICIRKGALEISRLDQFPQTFMR